LPLSSDDIAFYLALHHPHLSFIHILFLPLSNSSLVLHSFNVKNMLYNQGEC
jgi:hypothetical protein